MHRTLPFFLLLGACYGDSSLDTEVPKSASTDSKAPTVQAETTGGGSFAYVTSEWNIDFVHDSGASPERHLPETMGAGVAVFDLEGDGDLDLYFVQSGPVVTSSTEPFEKSRSSNRLYRNEAPGRFIDVSQNARDAADLGCGMGVATGDVDGDGDVDLFLSNLRSDELLLNQNDGTFLNATETSGIKGDLWTTGATLFDADNDGDLDLFVTGYVDIDADNPAWCGRREPGWRSYCHPDHYAGLPDQFWRNQGDGQFQDHTRSAGFGELKGKGLAVVALDFDTDGNLDLYVANDSVENHLWRNTGNSRFEDATLLSGTGVNSIGATEAGMGLACADIDDDLDLDLIVTNFDHESNTIYINLGNGLFRDATLSAGIEAASRLPVGFGCLLDDFDSDGQLDLVIANGHIIHNIDRYDDAQNWRQHPQYFRGLGNGKFEQQHEGLAELERKAIVGRGLASGDLDGDGDLDLIFTECNGPPLVFRNDFESGNAIQLNGLAPGTRAIVRLDSGEKILRTAGPAPSYLSSSHQSIHVGLGDHQAIGLEIHEPGQSVRNVEFVSPRSSGTWNSKDSESKIR